MSSSSSFLKTSALLWAHALLREEKLEIECVCLSYTWSFLTIVHNVFFPTLPSYPYYVFFPTLLSYSYNAKNLFGMKSIKRNEILLYSNTSFCAIIKMKYKFIQSLLECTLFLVKEYKNLELLLETFIFQLPIVT